MAIYKTFEKDPLAVLDYTWDWSDWLEVGETILVATATSSSPDLVVENVSNTTTAAIVWLSGGVAGVNYFVDCVIETATRTDSRRARFAVRDR